jgi:lysophospholipase L1-like esterase
MTAQTSLPPQEAVFPPADAGPSSRAAGTKKSWWAKLLLIAVCLAALIDWFSATTQRLYVDEDSAASQQQGTVWQHFGVRGHEVVPEIITGDEARFTFPISLAARQTLRFTTIPDGEATYEINLANGGATRQLIARRVDRPQSERISIPSGNTELRFAVYGRIAWLDLRLTRQFHWPIYLVLFAVSFFALSRSGRVSWRTGNWLALAISTLLCLITIECVLRLFALKLAPAVLSARHDLGLVAPDPRWIDSPRYRQRLRPNLKTYCEWEFGDIVRMGFVPRELFGGEHHRYPFETDAEGFRNSVVREPIDVAVLGDSFAEAMTSPREEAWPARLEELTGMKVQNYGTSSFGPQQELYVLQDFAIAHRPRDVVLGYFAGNDLFDAERFDRWEHGGDKPGEEPSGWRLQKSYRGYEKLFLTTLVRVFLPATKPADIPAPVVRSRSGFDRGAFEIPTASGTTLRFAFMPPYLQKLAGSRAEIERSRGWKLARETFLRMKETCAEDGARLTIMFIPSKDEVYWPLVEHSLGRAELERSLDFISTYNHMPLHAADISANRLAQNELMREFCASAGIPLLDLTPVLEQAAASGRAVYFADDAHWNAAGHQIAAEELAKFLAQEP